MGCTHEEVGLNLDRLPDKWDKQPSNDEHEWETFIAALFCDIQLWFVVVIVIWT